MKKKVEHRKQIPWQPKSERGKRMAAIMRRGRDERLPLLSNAEVEKELAARKGREF